MIISLCFLCPPPPLCCCALELAQTTLFSPFPSTVAMPGVRGELRKHLLCNKMTLKEVSDGILRVCHLVPNIYWATKCFTSVEECNQGNKSINTFYGLGAQITGSRVTLSLIYYEPFAAFWPRYHVKGECWRMFSSLSILLPSLCV